LEISEVVLAERPVDSPLMSCSELIAGG
jgi:hypothetical protein